MKKYSSIIISRQICRFGFIIIVIIIEFYFYIRSINKITIQQLQPEQQQQQVDEVVVVIVQEQQQQQQHLISPILLNKTNKNKYSSSKHVSFSLSSSLSTTSTNSILSVSNFTSSTVNNNNNNNNNDNTNNSINGTTIITSERNRRNSENNTDNDFVGQHNQSTTSSTNNNNVNSTIPNNDIISYNNNIVTSSSSTTNTTITNTSTNNKTSTNNTTEKIKIISPPIRDHPHAGAVDSNGKYGYIANVTQLRSWMIQQYCTTITTGSSTLTTTNTNNNNNNTTTTSSRRCTLPFINIDEENAVCNVPPKYGVEGKKGGWDIVANIVQVLPDTDPSTNTATTTTTSSSPTVLCAVYTYHKKHVRIIGIAETWGWRCDGFFAASDQTIINTKNILSSSSSSTGNDGNSDNTTKKATNMYNEPPVEIIQLLHEGIESYDNMWQKTRSILSYMYDNYINEYDYFFVCGDDTHLIVENLKLFLIEYETNYYKHNTNTNNNNNGSGPIPNVTMYSGQIMKSRRGISVGGGGGYVISKQALIEFVTIAIPLCYPHATVSAEDRFVSNCMKHYLNISISDPADALGKQRFHGFSPDAIAKNTIYYMFHETYNYWIELRDGQNFTNPSDIVSNTSITFHRFKSIIDMKRHHAILYRSCPNTTIIGTTLLQ